MSKAKIESKGRQAVGQVGQKTEPQIPKVAPAYATAVEAAAFMRISRGMVIKMAKDGELPYRRFGRNFRFPWRWLREHVPQ